MIEEEYAMSRVLIVDDERDMRHILRAMLRDIGLKNVQEAHDVKNALHIARTSVHPIDLVLCDWNMPGRPGLELLKEMRLDGDAPPFLIVSGRGDHDSAQSAKEAGVVGYIRKPFTAELIEMRISQALRCAPHDKVL